MRDPNRISTKVDVVVNANEKALYFIIPKTLPPSVQDKIREALADGETYQGRDGQTVRKVLTT